MKTNVLVALKNILENSNNELINVYKGITYNRANNMGDALGITNLRVRGMWSIKHPMKVFTSLVNEYNDNTNLQIYCLILKEKYDLLPKEDKECLKKYIDNNTLIMNMVRIKNPNNPVKFLDAVFFKASL